MRGGDGCVLEGVARGDELLDGLWRMGEGASSSAMLGREWWGRWDL